MERDIKELVAVMAGCDLSEVVELELTDGLLAEIRSRASVITGSERRQDIKYAQIEGTGRLLEIFYNTKLHLAWCSMEDAGAILGGETLQYLLKDF